MFDGTEELHKIIGNDGIFTTCLRLSKFISYDDCVLRYGGHKNGRILDTHDLSELMNIPYNTLRKHLAVLIKLGIIINNKSGNKNNANCKEAKYDNTIVVNPDVYMRGCMVDKTLLAMFSRTGWANNKIKLTNEEDIKEESATNE